LKDQSYDDVKGEHKLTCALSPNSFPHSFSKIALRYLTGKQVAEMSARRPSKELHEHEQYHCESNEHARCRRGHTYSSSLLIQSSDIISTYVNRSIVHIARNTLME